MKKKNNNNNEYTIQNTFTLLGEWMKISNANGYVLARFDVSNLFTNIPLEALSNFMEFLIILMKFRDLLKSILRNFWTSQLKISCSFSMENCINR